MVVTTRAHSEAPSTPKPSTSPSTPSSSLPGGPSRSTRSRITPKPSTPLPPSSNKSTTSKASPRTRQTARVTPRATRSSSALSIERDEETDGSDVFVELPRIKGLDKAVLSLSQDRFLPILPEIQDSSKYSPITTVPEAVTGVRIVESRKTEVTSIMPRSSGIEESSSDTIAQEMDDEGDLDEAGASKTLAMATDPENNGQNNNNDDDGDSSTSSSPVSDSEDDSDSNQSNASSSSSSSSSTRISPSSPSSTPDLNALLAAALQTASLTSAQKIKEKEERNMFDEDVMKLEGAVKERPIPGLEVPALPKKLLNIQAARHPRMKDVKGKGKARDESEEGVARTLEVDDGVYQPQLTKGQKLKLPPRQSANDAWSSLPTIPSSLLPQMKRDYQALSLGNSLDPKRFMKGGEKARGKIPEKFAIGTLITPSRRLASSTISTVQTYQPGSIVNSLVKDGDVGVYAKRKFGELQGKRMENGRNNGWKKRKGGW